MMRVLPTFFAYSTHKRMFALILPYNGHEPNTILITSRQHEAPPAHSADGAGEGGMPIGPLGSATQ